MKTLDWWNWLIKWIKSVSMGSYQYKNQVNGEFFAYPVSNFTVFYCMIWKLIRSIIWQLSNWSLGVFSKQVSIEIVQYEDSMLILGQNVIFCGHNVVIFLVWFLELTVFKYLVASHVTEPGSLLTEPCAVIKFSHFCSHPVHVCYNTPPLRWGIHWNLVDSPNYDKGLIMLKAYPYH